MKLIITDCIHKHILKKGENPQIITMREFNTAEISLIRKMNLYRYYMPSLTESEIKEFFEELDNFWNQTIKHFNRDHYFWRNVVSSKIQDGEKSVAHLALLLFVLHKRQSPEQQYIFVCNSIKEAYTVDRFASAMAWDIQIRLSMILHPLVRYILQHGYNTWKFLRMSLIFSYFKIFSPWFVPKHNRRNKNVLISTHSYPKSFIDGTYHDYYFGHIHNEFKSYEYSVTYITDPLDNFRLCAKKIKECNAVDIILIYSLVSWYEHMLILLRILSRSFTPKLSIINATFLGVDFSELIQHTFQRVSYFNFHAEFYYTAVMKLCKTKSFDMFLYPHEGNICEMACIQAFKRILSTPVIGYSHADICPMNIKMYVTDYEKTVRPEPDYFVASGNYSKDLLYKLCNRDPNKVRIGTFMRELPIVSDPSNNRSHKNTILIATEGYMAAVKTLDWVFENSRVFFGLHVVLRGHPNVPINSLLQFCIKKKPDNFTITHESLKQNLESSLCVVYRQTSVGMQALLYGIPVIHLNIDSPMSTDPLFEFNEKGKWSVKTSKELEIAINEIKHMSTKEKTLIKDHASLFIKQYFAPHNNKTIEAFISTQL
ncbi:MAG: hypothetical protein HQL06_04715 [Nitrospirae bacterium]|nr:hypothetical protein [Nitrospirota bacterium]